MPESQLHSDVHAVTGALEGEAADVSDETSGFADEPPTRRSRPRRRMPPSRSSLTRSPSSRAELRTAARRVVRDPLLRREYENRVKTEPGAAVPSSLNVEEYIFQAEVPTGRGRPRSRAARPQDGPARTVLPGYVLVRLDLTDESWAVVRNTPGVTGFVGLSSKPSPLPLGEVASLLAPAPAEGSPAAQAAAAKKTSPEYEVGESVTVTDGPFATLAGDRERGQPGYSQKVKGLVSDLRPGDARSSSRSTRSRRTSKSFGFGVGPPAPPRTRWPSSASALAWSAVCTLARVSPRSVHTRPTEGPGETCRPRW